MTDRPSKHVQTEVHDMKTACVRVQGRAQMIIVVTIGAWPVAGTINTHACSVRSTCARGSMDFACSVSHSPVGTHLHTPVALTSTTTPPCGACGIGTSRTRIAPPNSSYCAAFMARCSEPPCMGSLACMHAVCARTMKFKSLSAPLRPQTRMQWYATRW